MDGNPKPKTKSYRGQACSETRYHVCIWLEKELPKISGKVINISAGGWQVPKQLLNFTKITEYKTLDRKLYGDRKNSADFYEDVHNLPANWNDKWDCIINNQAIECYENPFKAMSEMYRVLKPGGILLIDAPFNYRFFGSGTGVTDSKNPVKDYWRITRDGWEVLTKQFSKVEIKSFGGTGEHDRFVYCIRAIK